MKSIFSFDAETDGLWGNPFAIAATVTSPEGIEVSAFALRLNDSTVTNDWVKDNVIPHIQEIEMCESYEALLKAFSGFYTSYKGCDVIIAHCPNPVEAHLLREMHRLGFIGDWDGPFPLIGIEGLLDAAGEDPTSATGYAEKHGLQLPEGSAHNPLFDCRLATTMYRHLKGWK